MSHIGTKGAIKLSEALKTNTTLVELNLWGDKKSNSGKIMNLQEENGNTEGNEIGIEGVRQLGESLKTNTTLTSLNLNSKE